VSGPRNVRRPARQAPLVPIVRNVRRPVRLALPDEEPVRWWHWIIGAIVVIVLSIDNWN